MTAQTNHKEKGKVETLVDNYTPNFIKRACLWFVSLLPKKWQTWVKANKMKTIYGAFIFRGLFLRPSMWILYAAMFNYLA
jgi:predicted secreted acid phosphatase